MRQRRRRRRRERRRGVGTGGAEEDTTGLDDIETLPHHGNHGARGEVLDKTREEGLRLEVIVVLRRELSSRLHQLQGHELEALETHD